MSTWVRSSDGQDVTFRSCLFLRRLEGDPESGEAVLEGPTSRYVLKALE